MNDHSNKGSVAQEKPFNRFELGLYSFAELTPDSQTGVKISPTERLDNLIESVVHAEEVGLDMFALGEHHRPDFVSSAPSVILAAAAARTSKIKLSSAVTVLSSDDPVRVFQRYATLDLLSHGRAEIIAGRGSFIESFPLFGYELSDYDELFSEKLEMLLKIREEERVTWQGQHRAALSGQGIYPRPHQVQLPIWVAVGGTPDSVIRAGTLGLPLALAIIGGLPEQFGRLVELYWKVVDHYGHDRSKLGVSINSHGFVGDNAKAAVDDAFPAFKVMMDQIGRERGWPPMSRAQFDASTDLRGANFIGSPDEIIEKILFQHQIFGHKRLLLQLGVGTMPHDKIMRSIELLGTKVAPVVRAEIGNIQPESNPSAAV
ncbi:MAG: LLM class flavin-dependent oxidoreductase [Chloroflexota bacterium]